MSQYTLSSYIVTPGELHSALQKNMYVLLKKRTQTISLIVHVKLDTASSQPHLRSFLCVHRGFCPMMAVVALKPLESAAFLMLASST